MLFLYSNKVLKLLAKEHYKQPQKLVKMYSKEKNVKESAKTHGGDVVKDFAEQGAKFLLQQAGRGSKRRQDQRSNLSTTKRLKLCYHITVPRHTKWITEDESSHDDESSYDEESDSETPQASDDIY
jgi:hypothetical protein